MGRPAILGFVFNLFLVVLVLVLLLFPGCAYSHVCVCVRVRASMIPLCVSRPLLFFFAWFRFRFALVCEAKMG